jgi:hypothetical protein
MASFFVASLEGAMLLARGSGAMEHMDKTAERLLASVLPRKAKA